MGGRENTERAEPWHSVWLRTERAASNQQHQLNPNSCHLMGWWLQCSHSLQSTQTSVILQRALGTSTEPRPLGCDPLAYLAVPQVPSHPEARNICP